MSVVTSAKELGNLEVKLTGCPDTLCPRKRALFSALLTKKNTNAFLKKRMCVLAVFILDLNKNHLAEAAVVFSGTFVAGLSFNFIFFKN